MLSIETLTYRQATDISANEEVRFRCFVCEREPIRFREIAMGQCQACTLARRSTNADANGVPNVAGWELAYIATGRYMARAWAPRVFETLGTDSPYAARIRGFLLTAGVELLRFEGSDE